MKFVKEVESMGTDMAFFIPDNFGKSKRRMWNRGTRLGCPSGSITDKLEMKTRQISEFFTIIY